MGQGTESCGGYEVDYDPHREGLATREWTMKSGDTIDVDDMEVRHLRNARRLAHRKASCATFSDDADKWYEWVEIFTEALDARKGQQHQRPKKSPAPSRGSKTAMVCHCGTEYLARNADIARGWGFSCSKRCAAIRRDFGRPAARKKH